MYTRLVALSCIDIKRKSNVFDQTTFDHLKLDEQLVAPDPDYLGELIAWCELNGKGPFPSIAHQTENISGDHMTPKAKISVENVSGDAMTPKAKLSVEANTETILFKGHLHPLSNFFLALSPLINIHSPLLRMLTVGSKLISISKRGLLTLSFLTTNLVQL
jgi:hypothetical protein